MTASLPPYPTGWYALAFSTELPVSGVLSRVIAGQEVVLYRTTSGQPNVIAAHCPHLGAHLGMGGTVVDETIRCPFHGFCFDSEGVCVATGYGTSPPHGLSASAFRVQESNGVIFVWHGQEAPTWSPPVVADEGWGTLVHNSFTLRDHPQETTENSVDLGHFEIVHGYRNVKIIEPVRTNGARLQIGYTAQRTTLGLNSDFEYRIDIHGLGYSRVDLELPEEHLSFQLFVLPTPTDGEHVDLHLGLRVRQFSAQRPKRLALRFLPNRVGEWIVSRLVAREFQADAQTDFPIWENKAYVHPPRLAEGDGPIGVYRKWARQFYADA